MFSRWAVAANFIIFFRECFLHIYSDIFDNDQT